MSGAGKSQMIRSVCSEIDNEKEWYVIWHVQCPQREETLRQDLLAFATHLRACYPNQDIQEITQDGKTERFISSLAKMPINVLLAFEDSENEKDKRLVRDLIRNIMNVENVQLVLVTQLPDVFYPNNMPDDCADYKMFQVIGFTEDEAVTFLTGGNTHVDDSVELLAKELAYSPFRLYIAREFCKKYDISYKSYHEDLGKGEYIIQAEKRLLEKHPHLGKHTYEVVARMLKPKNQDEEYQKIVINMLSFLNNVAIPGALIGKFFRESYPIVGDAKNESLHVQILLKRLQDEFSAAVYSVNEDYVMISFIHRDILTAVRFNMNAEERRNVIIKVLRSMSNLIGKDNRDRKDNTLLSDMNNHLTLVFQFAEELLGPRIELSACFNQTLDILICLSHLCGVVGFVTSQLSDRTDDAWFEKATKYLLDIVRYSLTAGDHGFDSTNFESHLRFAGDWNPDETARVLYEMLHKASQKIGNDWIQETNNRIHPITMPYVRDMKKRWPGLQWNDIEDRIKSMTLLDQEQRQRLQNAGAVIEPNTFRNIFLAEDLASLLHSRGRQMFYLKKTIKIEDRRQFEWFTDLGFSLCKIIHEKTGIKSIFEYLIEANNILHRLLVPNLNGESDADFMDRLHKARTLAEQVLHVEGDFYEHGKYKLVPGGPYTKMNALNYLVKANTKIYARRHLVPQFANGEEDSWCNQLLVVGKEFAPKFSFASNCLINAARYLGAAGKYDMAMQAIEMGFDTNSIGINNQRDIKVETCVWALYNSGRVLYASQGNVENFMNHCAKFFTRYKLLKDHKGPEISTKWHEDIDDMNSRLELLYAGGKK